MLWVVVFAVLAVLALAALGYCGLRVWHAVRGLSRQIGVSGQRLGGQAAALTEALDRMGAPAAPRRR